VVDVTDNPRGIDPLLHFFLEVLIYGVAIGLLFLGSFLIVLFSQADWHLTKYITLAIIFLLSVTVLTLWRRSRRRYRLRSL
jgi:hypothetical protein